MDRMDHHKLIQLASPAASSSMAHAAQSSDGRLSMCPALYLAARKGQTEEVKALLRRQQHGGSAAADQATGGPHLSGIQCEQCNCDIHEVSAEGNNVFHLAAEQGHAQLIQELDASFGGEGLLSSRNSALDTPLHCAARAGHDRAVSLLVQLARDCGEQSIFGYKNEAGDTALHLAARHGYGAVVEVVVSVAPELASELNNAGVSPLYLAVMSRSVPAVTAITTSARCRDASAVGPCSQNALHAAVFQGLEMVDLLLKWEPSLAGEVDGSSNTPLHFASSDGDRSIVSAILHAVPSSTVNMRDLDGLSALHVAAGMGHVDVVKELMKVCPDAAELRDSHGGTFLHIAAKGGHCKVVSLAIMDPTLGGLLNAQDKDGNTPLHHAMKACMPVVVETLIRNGKVRVDIMNSDGNTPFDLAEKSSGFMSAVSLVVELTAFHAQSRPQRQDHVEQWSDHGIAQWIEATSDNLALIASIIATVAFSAAFNIPGSYDDEGMAVLQEKTVFKYFLILDSTAMITSVIAVVLLIYGRASRSAGSWKTYVAALHFLWVSLSSMIIAFYAALDAVTTTRAVSRGTYNVIYVFSVVFYTVVGHFIAPPYSMRTIWRFLWRTRLKGRHAVIRGRIRRQYPFAGSSELNLLLFMAINVLAIVGFVTVPIIGKAN